MNKLTKYKIELLVVISILVIAAAIFFLNRTQLDQINQLQSTRLTNKTALEDSRAKLNALESQNKKADEVTARKDYVLTQVPQDVEATLFASKLEKLGSTMGVTPLTVSIGTAAADAAKSGITPTGYTLTFSAPFSTFINFIAELEQLDRLNSVESFTLNPEENGLAVSLGGSIYQFKGSGK